jgi:hypothetical protein
VGARGKKNVFKTHVSLIMNSNNNKIQDFTTNNEENEITSAFYKRELNLPRLVPHSLINKAEVKL